MYRAPTLPALADRLHDMLAERALRHPAAPALHEAGQDISYGALWAAVQATAARLAALGIRPGDRVMGVGENCAALVCLTFAAGLCDAWIVGVNARLSAREVDELRDHSSARRVFYMDHVSPDAAAHGARHGAQAEDSPFGSWLVGPLAEDVEPEPVYADGARQCAALVYTSGTTGRPKGVMLSHRSLLYVAAVSSTLRGLVPADRAYGALPVSHVYGLASVLLGTLHAGACLHLVPRFAAPDLLRALREDGLTILQGVPAMYVRLLGLAGAPLAHSLRFIYAGGSPLTPVLKENVEKAFGLPLHNGYGMTESAPTISQTPLAAPRSDTSVGYPIPGVATRVAADGRLSVRGPNVMLGYYRDAALTTAALQPDGWLDTGDIVRQAADGALFVIGRAKEVIIRAGFNVYPLEVETVLNAHPAVTQSAVVGRPAAHGDEEVIAFVELAAHPAIDEAGLLAHAAAALAPYKVPARIVALPALPAGATGKVLKGQLQQMARTAL